MSNELELRNKLAREILLKLIEKPDWHSLSNVSRVSIELARDFIAYCEKSNKELYSEELERLNRLQFNK